MTFFVVWTFIFMELKIIGRWGLLLLLLSSSELVTSALRYALWSVLLRSRGEDYQRRRSQTNYHISCGRGDFSNAASNSVSSMVLMNAKMASWWALSAGAPSESCYKHCPASSWEAAKHKDIQRKNFRMLKQGNDFFLIILPRMLWRWLLLVGCQPGAHSRKQG